MAVGRQWNEHVIAALFVTFLFLCVAVLGAALYLAQRIIPNISGWRCSASRWPRAVRPTLHSDWPLMPLSFYRIFTLFTGRIFMAVTLEFVLRFTASPSRRLVRIVQIAVLLLPFVYFVHLDKLYEVLSVAAEVVFCLLVCVLLFRAWRRGKGEAGVMLLPFFLAATADSADTVLDFARTRHWLPEQFASHRFYLGPIEFGTSTVVLHHLSRQPHCRHSLPVRPHQRGGTAFRRRNLSRAQRPGPAYPHPPALQPQLHA